MNTKIELQKHQIVNQRYKVISLIGQGGFGKTYLAWDEKTRKDVVLKVLYFSEVENWKKLELFEREISVLQNLDHKFIPDYIDSFETKLKNETLFILVQEYVNGSNLYEYIKSGKKFKLKQILEIFKKLLNILKYIHGLNPAIIHRDINPKNIIINDKDEVYLVDFGAVGHIVATTLAAARSDTFVGTLGYMPPEQLFGKVTKTTDIYSLGVTILFLLTGKEPSEFEMIKLKLNFNPYVDIPEYLEVILDLMLEPESEERIQDSKEILKLLKQKKEVEVKKESKPKEAKRPVVFHNITEKNYKTHIKDIKNPKRLLSTKTRIHTNQFGFYGKLVIAGGILFLLIFSSNRFLSTLKFAQVNAKTMGVIVMRRPTSVTVNKRKVYKIYFKFVYKQKEYFQYSYSRNFYYRKGKKAVVEFIKENPAFSRLLGSSYNMLGGAFSFLILFLTLGTGIVLYILGITKGKRRLLILYKKGVITNAGILDRSDTGYNTYEYSYAFNNLEKQRIKASYVTNQKLGKTGSLAHIIYHPRTNYSKIIEYDDVVKMADTENMVANNKIFAYYACHVLAVILLIFFIGINYGTWVKGSYVSIKKIKYKKSDKRNSRKFTTLKRPDSFDNVQKPRKKNANSAKYNAELILAVKNKDYIKAKIAIKKGADVDTFYGSTPVLMLAIDMKAFNIFKLLLDNGANPNIKNAYKEYALIYALVSRYLRAHTAKLLISKGANVNIKDNRGKTPLMWAIVYDLKDVMKELIKKGADIEHKDKYGNTALIYAVTAKNEFALRLLIKNKADLNTKNKFGIPALYYSLLSRRWSEKMSLILINSGADLNIRDRKNRTPLMCAVINRLNNLAELILSKRVNVNAKDKNGNTALHHAVRRRNAKAIPILIKHGADASIENNSGSTPLDLAKRINNRQIQELLIRAGAK